MTTSALYTHCFNEVNERCTSEDDGLTLHTYKPCRDLLRPRRCVFRLTVLQGLEAAQEGMM